MEIYIVQPKDDVDTIAARHKITVEDLIWANQIAYPYRLAVGQAEQGHRRSIGLGMSRESRRAERHRRYIPLDMLTRSSHRRPWRTPSLI